MLVIGFIARVTLLQSKNIAQVSTAAVLVLTAIVATIRWTWKKVSKIIRFFKELEATVAFVKTQMNFVEGQMRPNNGSSLRDGMNRVQAVLGVKDIPGEVLTHGADRVG